MDRVFGDHAAEADVVRRAEILRELKGTETPVDDDEKEL